MQRKRFMKRGVKAIDLCSGHVLVELIVGIVIIGMAMISYYMLQEKQQNIMLARKKGEELAFIEKAFSSYFITNRQDILDAIAASDNTDTKVQSHCIINVSNVDAPIVPGSNGQISWSGGPDMADGKKTCSFDLSLLQAKGFYPKSMEVTAINPVTHETGRYVAIVRRIRKPGTDGVVGTSDDIWTNDAEMLIVFADEDGVVSSSDLTKKWQQKSMFVTTQADVLGGKGGYVPVGNYGSCHATQAAIEACGNGWKVNLADWIDSGQLDIIKNVLPN